MARIVIMGAGVAGHTAALHLRRQLGSGHTVTVVTPNAQWNWIPSNIWVGVGRMPKKKVLFPLAPLYRRKGIIYRQALAREIHPEGDADDPTPFIRIEHTAEPARGQTDRIPYDYLVNATGPKLNFAATPGLGPEQGGSVSVCTADHAEKAADALGETLDRMRRGEHQTIVIGTGHGTCTCEGAAFEYTFNVEHTVRQAGLRDMCDIHYFTNEYELGDFGVAGLEFNQQGYRTNSRLWTESLFRERGVIPIVRAHARRVEDGVLDYETLDGGFHQLHFDFAMLLPPFRGADLTAVDRDGNDITSTMFSPNAMMYVDADYSGKDHDSWKASDWPRTYRSAAYDNIWAPGIAFAPPHPISEPHVSPNGTVISPSPPRTGMPAGIQGKLVADTITDRILRPGRPDRAESMTEMGSACIASAGSGLLTGSAASMTMYPTVPDHERYPGTGGRHRSLTFGEIGLAGHWIKTLLHHGFIYKMKGRPLWWLIPE
ncbi:NAD(P)/FAD-dependent oxidoreductase [uncultured Corynebacterium sp.]|uniref:NAD(P)/FAD-dependent oxidoreductase n=1 Tax=uncultured Corynebacterium sp. TaxID=159447 RepID=UPI0025D6D70A|nr:FAD/NAD(P)-binding oxidoreductase [uncultured Corynebacterium sp.]